MVNLLVRRRVAMEGSLEERVRLLEEQTKKLEAANEIRKVMAKYAYTMDKGDWDGVMSCYSKECSADFGSVGGGMTRAEVGSFYRNQLSAKIPVLLHRITNEVIEVKDEQTATGRWYMNGAGILGATQKAIWIGHTYYADFVKEDDKWLLKRLVDSDWRFVTDFDKGWAREPFTLDPRKQS